MHVTTIHSFENFNFGQIGPIKQVDDGVYMAEAIAPTGEKMYVAMEPLGEDKLKWISYKIKASFLVNGGDFFKEIGSLVNLGSRINNEIILKEFLALYAHSDFWTGDTTRFEKLRIKLQERNIIAGSPKAKELLMIPHASNGLDVSLQTHMVYVSKSPITGRVHFTPSATCHPFSFGAYADQYEDLIMSVGVTIENVVENRGIFRNPLSVIDGGYGGIAMMIHSFTCMVVQDYYPFIETFKVRPLKKMGEIFFHSLPKEKITINGIFGDSYTDGFEQEHEFLVPVKVLASLYRIK